MAALQTGIGWLAMSFFRPALAITLISSVPLLAQSSDRAWQEALVRADNELKAGHFEEANRRLLKLSGAIGEKMASGSEAMYTVAVIASFRAIAAAGRHNIADVEWYWSVATSFFPKFKGSNLRVYGAAGETVMGIDASRSCILQEHFPHADIKPPKAIRNPMPRYPYHAIETGIAERITVQVIITEAGETRCPQVVETHDDPSLAWVLLEAMKSWRFEPATVAGKPVPVPFNQTVDFRIRY